MKLRDKKRPYADPTSKRRSVTVNDEDWEKLKTFGDGSPSEGIRRLVRVPADWLWSES